MVNNRWHRRAGLLASRPDRLRTGPRCWRCRRSRRSTGWARFSQRLPRDHYVRLDGNDYSVHPSVIGRRIEISRDLQQIAGPSATGGSSPTTTGPGQDTRPSAATPSTCHRGRSAPPGTPGASCARHPDLRSSNRDLADYDTIFDVEDGMGTDARPVDLEGARRGRVMAATRPRRGPRRTLTADIAHLTKALKAPTLRDAVDRLAERARAENWTHEEFLVACLQREVSARDSHGGEGRIRAARFPARKSLEEFDFDHARGLKRETVAHLGTSGLRHRERQRRVPRTARDRQNPPRDRDRDPGLPGRAPRPVRHRLGMGRPPRRAAHRAGTLQPSSSASAATRCW